MMLPGRRGLRCLAGAVGLSVVCFGLTACEFTTDYEAACGTDAQTPLDEPGVVTMTADVPTKVEAGSTFTITVKDLGVALGPSDDPPPADYGWFLSIGAEPGRIDLGSAASPATWPEELELTVTGQPGEYVLFGIIQAQAQIGEPPDEVTLYCGTSADDSHGLFAEIEIVAPD
jgi:hypothetical protein